MTAAATDPAPAGPGPAEAGRRELGRVEVGAVDGPEGGAAPPVRPAGTLNIANGLTVGRFLLVPVFLAFMFADGGHSPGWRIAAALVYGVAAFTDQVDGWLARRRGLVTTFGTLADPIADKALTGAALVSLSWLGDLPWAVTVLIAVREIGVTLLRLWALRFGVIPASRGGKLKTLLLNLAIGLYVLPLSGPFGTIRAVVMAAGIVVALVTGVDYTARALALRRRAAAGALAVEPRVEPGGEAATDAAPDPAPEPLA